jgi:hypothetical protein
MIMKGNTMERHSVAAGVPMCSPVSRILFPNYTAGRIKLGVEYMSETEGLSFVDYLGCFVTMSDVDHVVSILVRRAAKSVQCTGRRGLQFNRATMEAALLRADEATGNTSCSN